MQNNVSMKAEQDKEDRLTRAQQLLNELWDKRVPREFTTTAAPDAYVDHIRVLTGVGPDQLNEFYSKHFDARMSCDTEFVPASRTIGSKRLAPERLVDDERPSM